MGERLSVKQMVLGSNPSPGAKFKIELTGDFVHVWLGIVTPD